MHLFVRHQARDNRGERAVEGNEAEAQVLLRVV